MFYVYDSGSTYERIIQYFYFETNLFSLQVIIEAILHFPSYKE